MSNQPPPPLQLPFITRLKLAFASLSQLAYTRRDGTINRSISNLFDIKSPSPSTKLIKLNADRTVRVSTSDISIDPSRNLWFRLFVPSNNNTTESLPLLIYYHGGGFMSYGPDSKPFHDLCSHLAAKLPAVVASVDYRLAPEFKYPTQYEDGFDALKYIDEQDSKILSPEINIDFERCFVAGDSAGGNIAHHVTVRALADPHRLKKIKIAGLVLLQPFFGGEERTQSELRLTNVPMISVPRTDIMWRCFLPDGSNRNHPAARVFGIGSKNSEADLELKGIEFPSALVVLGGYDPLQDWQRRYVEWLRDFGKEVKAVEYEKAFHGFYAFDELPEFKMLCDNVREFVRETTQKG